MEAYLRALGTGKLHPFATWQQAGVPHVAAGVYTIWRALPAIKGSKRSPASVQFVYVGYAGRGLTKEKIAAMRTQGERNKALRSRLQAHASGRRSGDQFAVFVADRFVMPAMNKAEIQAVATGALDMDGLVQQYISADLAFRWVETPDGATAMAVEKELQRGRWAHGQPCLNPR